MGYDSEVTVNGVEAIEALRRTAFDVVFMDVQMPVMDGIEAARQIHKEWAPGQRPRIIALTAGVMADEIQTCKIAGMDDFLAKPIDVERLAATLAACRRLDASRRFLSPCLGTGQIAMPAASLQDSACGSSSVRNPIYRCTPR